MGQFVNGEGRGSGHGGGLRSSGWVSQTTEDEASAENKQMALGLSITSGQSIVHAHYMLRWLQ